MSRDNETEILRRVLTALAADETVQKIELEDTGSFLTAQWLRESIQKPDILQDIIEECFACDDCTMVVHLTGGKTSFLYFIWGNGNDGWDAICDYGVKLEGTLVETWEWIMEQGA